MDALQDRIRGSLVGGAIGDALGYPVEFINTYEGIQERYGDRGITRLVPLKEWVDNECLSDKAVISDDTQMSLFTANGLLNAKRLRIAPKYALALAYVEWYLTQMRDARGTHSALCRRQRQDVHRGCRPPGS